MQACQVFASASKDASWLSSGVPLAVKWGHILVKALVELDSPESFIALMGGDGTTWTNPADAAGQVRAASTNNQRALSAMHICGNCKLAEEITPGEDTKNMLARIVAVCLAAEGEQAVAVATHTDNFLHILQLRFNILKLHEFHCVAAALPNESPLNDFDSPLRSICELWNNIDSVVTRLTGSDVLFNTIQKCCISSEIGQRIGDILDERYTEHIFVKCAMRFFSFCSRGQYLF